jgi:serine phosphatase RsbU (regulator of sigma subunit)
MELSARGRRVLLGAAPFAFAVGLVLRLGVVAPQPLRFGVDRDQAIGRARAIAKSFGVDAGTQASVKVTSNEERRIYNLVFPESPQTARLVPPYEIEVSLSASDGEAACRVTLTPSGQLLGFDAGGKDDIRLTDSEARVRAQTEMQTAIPDPGLSGVRLRVEASVREGQLTRLNIDPEFEESFRRREVWTRKGIRDGVGALGFAFVLFTVIYSLRLYRRRSREQEVPRERMKLLIVGYGVLGVCYVLTNIDGLLTGGNLADMGWWLAVLVALMSAVFFFLAGVLLAVAYAGGEGEIREGYPGKLTSFDAVLAGKPWSRNAGVSVMEGAACAAWAFLALAVVDRLSAPVSAILVPDGLLSAAFSRVPPAGILLREPLLVMWTIVSGLVVPLTFLRRRARSVRATMWLLLAARFVVGLGFSKDGLSALPPFADVVIGSLALVVPFFPFGLLAAMTSATLFQVVTGATMLAPVVSGWWWSGGAALAIVLAALVPFLRAARRGEQVSDAEVRPRYVQNLERRLSLQAEVGAARQAQIRLLPKSPPHLPGMSIAATCLPAGEVGGDFYDFYPLDSGELAVFVASAGGSNVAAALTIALAKGFLVCDLRRGDGPEASLKRLLELLSGTLDPAEHHLALALAVFDPRRGSMRAARVGDSPGLWILRRDGSLDEPPFSVPSEAGPVAAFAVLAPGDAVLVHSEGLVRLLEDQSPSGLRNWMRSFARSAGGAAVLNIEHTMLDRLGGRKRKRISAERLRRDLTVTVVRMDAPAERETAGAA